MFLHFAARASAMVLLLLSLFHTISVEPEKLAFHLFLQVEVISTPQELPLSHRTFATWSKTDFLPLA